MNLLENFYTAMSAIMVNKMRSVLTMLGVIIGVYAVSTMMSLGEMATNAITNQLNQIGGSQVFVLPTFEPGKRVMLFTTDDVTALSRLPVQDLSGVTDAVQMSTPNFSGSISLQGVQADYLKLQGSLKLTAGRFFTESEVKNVAPVVVLTGVTARKLYGDNPTAAIGKVLRISQSLGTYGPSPTIRRDQLTVIGVLASEGGIFSGGTGDSGYIPISYAWRHFFTRGMYSDLNLKINQNADKERTLAEISNILQARRGEKNFMVESIDRYINQFKMVTGALQALLAATGALSLLVGGIGIMNIMLVSVTERTREIGLRKALGAQKSTILGQFLMEAVALTGLGGLIGYLASVVTVFLATVAMPQFFPVLTLSLRVALLALGVSISIGLLFGVWPARRAANLTPIEALRYE